MEIKSSSEIIKHMDNIPDDIKYDDYAEKFESKKWVAIDDLIKHIEAIYEKYLVPEQNNVPKVLIQAINHPISAMRAELLESLSTSQSEGTELPFKNKPLDELIDKSKVLDKCCKDEKFRKDEMNKARL